VARKTFQTEEFTFKIFVVCVGFEWGQRHNSGILVKSWFLFSDVVSEAKTSYHLKKKKTFTFLQSVIADLNVLYLS